MHQSSKKHDEYSKYLLSIRICRYISETDTRQTAQSEIKSRQILRLWVRTTICCVIVWHFSLYPQNVQPAQTSSVFRLALDVPDGVPNTGDPVCYESESEH